MENISGRRHSSIKQHIPAYRLLSLFFIPFVVLLLSESIQRNSVIEALYWSSQQKMMFVVNYSLLLSISLVLYILPKIAFLLTASVFYLGSFLFSYIHQVKSSLRGEPFLPADLYLINEAKGISNAVSTNIYSIIFLVVGGILIIISSIYLYPKYVWRKRLLLGLVSILMIGFLTSESLYAFRDRMGIKLIPWNQIENVRANGFAYSFVNNFMNLQVEKPFTYNKEEIQAIVNKTVQNQTTAKPAKPVKPNVIVIMSEAFFDPTTLPNVQFDRDPLPTVRQLAKTHTVGTVGVSQFGGGTANSEFEALTGLASEKLPYGAIAYSQYVYRPIDSLASLMKKNGYPTTAIHPYYHWYYNRTNVYKNIGFDRYIPMEFMTSAETKGLFIKDSEVAKRIIAQTKKTDGQDFVFAVTMQSHGPYDDQEVPINNHVSGPLSDEGKKILETYVNQIEDADRLLKTLIDEYKSRNEPTVIVMYGDHFPMLGSDYQVYKETKFITDISNKADFGKMHQTPLVIWDNIGLPKEKELDMQLPFLGAYLVDRIGLAGNTMTDLLMQGFDGNIRYLTEKFISPAKQKKYANNQQWKQDYDLLWYDILVGNQYVYTINQKPSVNPDYILGSGPIVIDSVNPPVMIKDLFFAGEKGESVLSITGKNFEGSSQISANGTLLPTTYIDREHIQATLPASLMEEKELNIEIKVQNERGDEIAKSTNKITIPVMSRAEFKEKSSITPLDQSLIQWEFFKNGNGFKVVRANLQLQDLPYIVAIANADLQDINADALNEGNQSDIYANGYLYISIRNEESKWKQGDKPTPDDIRKYFSTREYTLYLGR